MSIIKKGLSLFLQIHAFHTIDFVFHRPTSLVYSYLVHCSDNALFALLLSERWKTFIYTHYICYVSFPMSFCDCFCSRSMQWVHLYQISFLLSLLQLTLETSIVIIWQGHCIVNHCKIHFVTINIFQCTDSVVCNANFSAKNFPEYLHIFTTIIHY